MPGAQGRTDLNSAALARSGLLPARRGRADGRGIVICFLDYGFDLLHPSLCTAVGTSRFATLIDQNGQTLDAGAIPRLVKEARAANDRRVADAVYDPHAHYFGRSGVVQGAHGTWVASIAAGSRTEKMRGVAPAATLIGVQLALPDEAWREEDATGRPTWLDFDGTRVTQWSGWRSYEDATAIVDGLHEAFRQALALRPTGIVLNLSIGAWAGSHHADAAVNQAIAEITDQCARDPAMPMTAVVVGTGNAGNDGGHFSGRLLAGKRLSFDWRFPAGVSLQSKLEVWTDSDGPFRAALDVRGTEIGFLLPPEQTVPLVIEGVRIGLAERRSNVRGSLSRIRLCLQPSRLAQAGLDVPCDWRITLARRSTGRPATVHAWLERDDGAEAPSTLVPSSKASTLTSMACAPGAIAIAGLDNSVDDDAALDLSGRGPPPWPASRTELRAPHLAAPAHRIWGARSKSAGFMRGSGTSAATALVSGAAALVMQAAHARGDRLDRDMLLAGLLGKSTGELETECWQPDIGYGPLRLTPMMPCSNASNHIENVRINPTEAHP